MTTKRPTTSKKQSAIEIAQQEAIEARNAKKLELKKQYPQADGVINFESTPEGIVINEIWFFGAKNSEQHGPFDTEEAAEFGKKRAIRCKEIAANYRSYLETI